jgi:TonB family protein
MVKIHRKKQELYIFLALVGVASLVFTSYASAQADPFYLRLLEKAQKSFLARNYGDAARDLEIAAFGLNQDAALQAKAYFFLGLSHFYLRDSEKSANFLRQGAELLGDKDLAALGMPDSVLRDLETLLPFFDIQLASAAESINPPPLPEEEKQANPSESSLETDQISQTPAKKDPSPITLDNIKEGDIVALNLVDTLPVVTERIPAVYPSSAGGSKITGTVVVNALISEKGSVIKTEIMRGIKGVYGFNQAAEHAVRRWKFEPATIKGIKVKVWLPVRIVFKR